MCFVKTTFHISLAGRQVRYRQHLDCRTMAAGWTGVVLRRWIDIDIGIDISDVFIMFSSSLLIHIGTVSLSISVQASKHPRCVLFYGDVRHPYTYLPHRTAFAENKISVIHNDFQLQSFFSSGQGLA